MQISFNKLSTSLARPVFLNLGGFSVALLLVGVYFSTALATVASVGVGLLWLLFGRFSAVPAVLKRCPVAAWSVALFGVLLVGTVYGPAQTGEAADALKKFRELLFLPVLIPLLNAPQDRQRLWRAFEIASVVTLAISFLIALGFFESLAAHGASLKSRITHGIFISFFAFYCLHRALDPGMSARLYSALFLLSVVNVFFVVAGRTGQLIAVLLILLFACQRFRLKGRLLSALGLAVFLAVFLGFSSQAKRVYEGIENTQAYMQETPAQTDSSMGQRYTFWKYSFQLILEKPLFGYGTGSFAPAYERVAAGEKFLAQHPHNEFLLIAVQVGLLGLLPYLGFLGSQTVHSRLLPEPERWYAQGLCLSLVVTSLFNTPLYDHTEGHWFMVMIALCLAARPYAENSRNADA